jgi:hypothetical protein
MSRPAAALARMAAFVAACAPLAASAREVEYRAPAGCPSHEEVTRRLEASSPEGRPARIEVRRVAMGFSGEVTLGDGATRVLRTVDARSCVAVVEALTLVIALDHDPAAPEPASTEGAGAADAPSAPDPTTPAATAPGSGVLGPVSRDAPAGAAPASAATPSSVVIAFGATISATSFAEGSVLPGGALFVGIASGTGLAEIAWLKPSARLSFGRSLPTVTSRAGVTPELTLTAASLDVCPLSATSRLWQGAGALARVQWVLARSGDVRPMIDISGGVLAPLQRDRFHFGRDGSAPVTAPSYEGMLAISGGVVLP